MSSEAGFASYEQIAPASPVSWPSAPPDVHLGNDEIHLWCAALTDFHDARSQFHAVLSPDERVRAERFRLSQDRDRFVVCRGILRGLLGRYLRCDPSSIEFSYGRFGKPDISEFCAQRPVYFNVSHSADIALYAVSSACPVGVDVERLHRVPDFELIASQFFTPFETNRLMALPSDKRMKGFFTCWTGKEAFLKATGEGIGRGLAAVQVAPDEQPRVLCMDDSHPGPDWQFQWLWPAVGYVGAVAYRHDAVRLSRWTL
jgi:4'-phosphopantetheinyl transferase